MKANKIKQTFNMLTNRLDLKKAVFVFLLLISSKIYAALPGNANYRNLSGIDLLLLCIIVILSIIIFYKNSKIKDASSRAHSIDQRFRKLYDAGLVGLLFSNLDGTVVHANKAFLNIIGYTTEDVQTGKVNWNQLTPPEYMEVTQDAVKQMKERGFCDAFEKEYIRKDGQHVNIMLGSSLLDKNDFAEAVTYVIDISYKKQAEAREQELNNIIKKQREELYSILMNAPAMIVIRRGAELKLEFSNKAASDFVKYGSSLGLSTKEIMAKLKVMADPGISQEVYRTGKPYKAKAFHIQLDRFDKGMPEDVWLDMILEPVYDHEGNIDGVAFFGFDVTELVKANREVKESENKFSFLADAIAHKMWTSEPDGRSTYYNKGWYDYTGQTDHKELNKRIWEIIHPDDLEIARETWTRVISTGEGLTLEQRFMNLDGEYLWHLTRVDAHKDDEGKVIMWVGTCTNIHDQKKALEALKISEEHFRALSNNNSLIIWQVNAQGALIYVNDTWRNFTGLSLNDKLMEQTLDAVHPDDRKETIEKLGAEFVARAPMQTKFRFRNGKGQYRWVLTYANPIYNPEFAGYIGSMIDIDDQERAQKATRQLLKRKDEFLGIASHELKTPITSMKASLQILDKLAQTEFDPSKIKPFINMANKQVRKLTEIVDDLLDVTKIQSGKMQLNVSSYLFQDSVQDCITEMQQYTQGHQLIIGKNDLAKVIADRTRIEQVIANFLSNAIKYSPGKDQVIIDIEKADNQVKFSVTDFGIGIPPDKQSFIFDRFFRVHESSQNFSGLGLGLYISSEIIEKHKGRVGMKSEEGKGSTFWFTLPVGH
jgi:PAS domain S-box-containing protein